MPYLSFGGFSSTAGVTVYTRLDEPRVIRNIARPNMVRGLRSQRPFFSTLDWDSIARHRDFRLARLAAAPNLMPRAARNRSLYAAALEGDAPGRIIGFRGHDS